MTEVTVVRVPIECPVHAARCSFREFAFPGFGFPNITGTVLGMCERCGYQIEISQAFAVRYRKLDDPSVTLSNAEFERTRP